ncbi:SRPBCC family protein [Litoreibacter roseus]|uniref:Polyketide cyclase/dehydrase/lipid transport protein n=1 Tax=Litoreibacter roseus TaxID=2601869 RepID=A0A6N6JHJ9_9RHOB|nr:SRPBCC family protein [Litoreibacter roseus]GFE65726.1 hypothetical protein KIN_28000 [Litoreibacter roseus]
MAEVTTKRTINAPAEEVWASLDDYAHIATWNPNITGSRLMPGSSETGLGAMRQCDLKADGSQYLRERISEYVPGRKLVIDIYETTMPMKNMVGVFEVRPLGPNRSELSFSMRFTPPMGPVGLLMLPMMKPKLRRLMAKVVEGNAQHVERAAA